MNRLGFETDKAPRFPLKHNARELKLAETVREDPRIEDSFEQAPVVSATDNATGAPLPTEAAAGQVIGMHSGKHAYEVHYAAVESTGTAAYLLPKHTDAGLSIPLDADVTNGPTAVELGNGSTARAKPAIKPASLYVGEKYMVEAAVKIADVSDLDTLHVGFRKAAAYEADPDDYTDMAAMTVGGPAAGQIGISTIKADEATEYTDTTEADAADGETHILRVEVRQDGQVLFQFDGKTPAAVPSTYAFDSDDTLIPFIYLTNASGSTTGDPDVTLVSYKVGKV